MAVPPRPPICKSLHLAMFQLVRERSAFALGRGWTRRRTPRYKFRVAAPPDPPFLSWSFPVATALLLVASLLRLRSIGLPFSRRARASPSSPLPRLGIVRAFGASAVQGGGLCASASRRRKRGFTPRLAALRAHGVPASLKRRSARPFFRVHPLPSLVPAARSVVSRSHALAAGDRRRSAARDAALGCRPGRRRDRARRCRRVAVRRAHRGRARDRAFRRPVLPAALADAARRRQVDRSSPP